MINSPDWFWRSPQPYRMARRAIAAMLSDGNVINLWIKGGASRTVFPPIFHPLLNAIADLWIIFHVKLTRQSFRLWAEAKRYDSKNIIALEGTYNLVQMSGGNQADFQAFYYEGK